MIFVQQLAQMMILLISIIMQQYCVLVILARLSTDQGITILLFSCLYMLPFVFGHQMLQSGIELIHHEIFREILKKKKSSEQLVYPALNFEIIVVWMNEEYLVNWPDWRHQVSYQVSWYCCLARLGWGSGANLKGVSALAGMQIWTAWMNNQHPLRLSGMWIAGVQIVNTLLWYLVGLHM